MNRNTRTTTRTAIALAFAALLAGNALAADKSRADVAAELAQAQADGSIALQISTGELNGATRADIYPGYARTGAVQTAKTSAQVAAELQQAERDGSVAFTGSTGELRGKTLAAIYGNGKSAGSAVIAQASNAGDVLVKVAGSYVRASESTEAQIF